MDIPVIDASNGLAEKKNVSLAWWTYDENKVFEGVTSTAKNIQNRQANLRQQNMRNYKVYHQNQNLDVYSNMYSIKTPRNQRFINMNVVKSVIDTLASKIAKQRPRVLFLTEGGSFEMQKHAKKLSKFIDGCFDDLHHYQVRQQTFVDMCITGTGVTKFYVDWDKEEVRSERIFPDEILVDEMDALFGEPRSMYQRRFVNRDILATTFPKLAKYIYDASGPDPVMVNGYGATGELVEVIEAWHLPSSSTAKDGKRAMVISNHTLLFEDWDYDWFPFNFEHYTKPSLGFWGTGIVHELSGIQEEINQILQRIQESIRLCATPKVFIEQSSEVNKQALNNDIGTIITYKGQPPIFNTPVALTPEVYNYLENLYQKAYEIIGMSQLSAQSAKPSGLNSGVAFREYQDIESERFHLISQNRERTFLDDAKTILKLYQLLSEKNPKFKVKLYSGTYYENTNFKDLKMDLNKYVLRTYPTSLFPTQPAAKLQSVFDYLQMGLFDRDTAMELLDFPDLENVMNLELSPRRVIIGQLEAMVEDGTYSPPEPYLPLDLAKQTAQLFYLKSKTQKVPEKNLDLIRRYMSQCQTMQDQVNQAQGQLIQAQQIIQAQQQMQAEAMQDPTLINPTQGEI